MNWLSDRTLHRLQTVADHPDLSATKYRLLEKFSRGGMGTIYLAEDTQLRRKVALKVLHTPDDSGELSARMLREAHVIAQLEHPGIVPVHDVGELPDGRVFYVMKFVQGQRLDQYAGAEPALPNQLRSFQKACEAVAFAHAHGVIHRDLKPENIMVGAFGEVLVMDWGLAKIVGEGLEQRAEHEAKSEEREAKSEVCEVQSEYSKIAVDGSRRGENGRRASSLKQPASSNQPPATSNQHQTVHGTVMGTPAYMAPEQERGEIDLIDERTDVYALGAILRFLLLGSAAQNHAEAAATKPHLPNTLGHRNSPARKVPKSLTAICAKAMAQERNQRYASAQDLARDIERFLNGLSVSSYEENLLEKIWRWLRQYRFIVILVLVYLIVRILLILLLRP